MVRARTNHGIGACTEHDPSVGIARVVRGPTPLVSMWARGDGWMRPHLTWTHLCDVGGWCLGASWVLHGHLGLTALHRVHTCSTWCSGGRYRLSWIMHRARGVITCFPRIYNADAVARFLRDLPLAKQRRRGARDAGTSRSSLRHRTVGVVPSESISLGDPHFPQVCVCVYRSELCKKCHVSQFIAVREYRLQRPPAYSAFSEPPLPTRAAHGSSASTASNATRARWRDHNVVSPQFHHVYKQ